MKDLRIRRFLYIVFVGALLARYVAFRFHPSLHPDAFFQYVEPAYWHLHGSGWRAWEWIRGIRSWVLPSYHGMWLVVLEWFGIHDPVRQHAVLLLHWAAVNATMIFPAYTIGAVLSRGLSLCPDSIANAETTTGQLPTGWEGGIVAALGCAFFPTILYYAPQTLSEVPSTVAVVWGYALWLDGRWGEGKRAKQLTYLSSTLLVLAAFIRVSIVLAACVPAIDWLRCPRSAQFRYALMAIFPVAALFGIVDWVTWGTPFKSLIGYIQFNFIEHGADQFGVFPWDWYQVQVEQRLGWGAWILVWPIVFSITRVWPVLVPALLVFCSLASQPHKEDRFLALFWPFLLIAWGAAVAPALCSQVRFKRVFWWVFCIFVLGIAFGQNLAGIAKAAPLDFTGRWPVYRAQAWVGKQSDASGVLVGNNVVVSGGYFSTGRNIPLLDFYHEYVNNPVFNYFIVNKNSGEETLCKDKGFQKVWSLKGFTIYHRVPVCDEVRLDHLECTVDRWQSRP